jgi:DnaJ like chaperone protein
MTFWRNIASLAARRVDSADLPALAPECVDRPGSDPAFSTAVTALGAKLARADGQANGVEFAAFAEAFQPDAGSERNIRRLYDLARQTTHGFESYAKRLAKRYGGCPLLLEDVMDGLFHIAKADGAVTGGEIAYLERVAELFGFSPLTFKRLSATHLGQEEDDPYLVLGIAPDASDDELHAAWRTAIAAAHPDRARARGLPEDFVEIAESKAAAINAAYDAAVSERRQISVIAASKG